MNGYPLITYVAFAAIAAWAVLSLTRKNFRRGTNRRKSEADIGIWIVVAIIILVAMLQR